MSGVWQQSIARVLVSSAGDAGDLSAGSTPGAVIGTGALVLTPQYGACVLTAAHVVNAALGWSVYATGCPEHDRLIRFDLPAKGVGAGRIFLARVVEWAPPRSAAVRVQNPVSDVALLQVLGSEGGGGRSLPADLRLFRPEDFEVVADADLEGLALRSFGFLRPDGAFAEGKVQGAVTSGWLHLVATSDKGDFIAPGFSGAPMFDAGRQRILGMAIAIDPDDDKRLAFLQSTLNIWKACPELARPYPGLRAFQERDAPFFYGRDAFVARMLEKTKSCPLLGVTAASGSGKSSAIRAGLIPKLRASERTLLLIMRPLSDPWKQLALGISRLATPDADPLAIDDQADSRASLLRESPQKLMDYAQALLEARGADRLIIFVDQFEELFTLAGHEREERAEEKDGDEKTEKHAEPKRGTVLDFRELMASTARLTGSPQLQWIYALRGDFAGRAFRHPAFVDCLRDGDVKLPDMTADELHAAVSQPAAAFGVVFEVGTATQAGLIGRIAEAAGATAGALPLMQHVLDQLWREMRDRRLTHEAYDRLGGLRGALNLHADRVFGSLSEQEQILARRLFSRLVNVEEDGEATRRVATWGEVKKELQDSVWAVAQKLAGEYSRLLTLNSGTAGDGTEARTGAEETVEVAHEALLRDWEMLKGWMAEDRRFLLWRRRLEQQLRDHKDAPDKTGTWLTGGPLQIAVSWCATRDDDLSQEELEFVNASENIVAEEARRNAESAKREHRRARQLIAALVTILGVTVAAAAGGFWLTIKAQAVRDSAEDDASRYAAAIAERLISEGQPALALKVVRAHLPASFTLEQVKRKPATFSALAQTVSYYEQDPGVLRGHKDKIWAASFSPNGTRIVTASWDNTARLWDTISGRPIAVLRGHEGTVTAASFSPDGTRIVTASDDNRSRLWDAVSGRPLAVLKGHGDKVRAASFSPNGTRIVTASWDNTARLWDTASGYPLAVLEGHERPVTAASFSPDGTRIITASKDETARLWDAVSGRPIAVLKGHESAVWAASFSPNGTRVVTASADNTARLWDAMTGYPLAVLKGHENTVWAASTSPDGSRIVTTSSDKTARLWDAATGRTLAVLKGHEGRVNAASFSPDGTRIVTASEDKTARLWDAVSGQPLAVLEGDENTAWAASFSPDGTRIVTASIDRTARLWDAASGRPLAVFKGHENTVTGASFSPDGTRIITPSSDNTARLWDAASGQTLAVLKGHEDTVHAASFSPDGKRIVTASQDTTARLWDAASGYPLAVLEGHERPVTAASFSPDGTRIITASGDTTARLWDAASGQTLAVLKGHDRWVTAASFSPDGKRIVTASNDAARLWDAASGRPLAVLKGHDIWVNTASFSPDGKRIVTASDDRTARLWEAASGLPLAVLKGHGDKVNAALFSPDGSRIVTLSRDNTGRLWDAVSGRPLAVLKGHKSAITTASFSPDGTRIATASGDTTARLWDAGTGQSIAVLKGHQDKVTAASFSPDGTRVVTASGDKTARLWNVSPAMPYTDAKGAIRWTLHPPFSQALLDRADLIVPERLTEQDREEILKESRVRDDQRVPAE